jgi:O-antigen ligase
MRTKTKAKATRSRAFGVGWPSTILEAGLLLVLPLVFYRGFAEQFTYTKIVVAQALVFAGLAVWALGFVWGRFRRPDDFRLALPLGVLSAVILLSCFTSPVSSFSFSEAEYFLCGPLWLFLLVTRRRGKQSARTLGGFIAAAGALAAGIALLQWSGHDPLLFGGYGVQWGTMVSRMRLYSTFGNPNFLCGYLIGAVFAALALALTVKDRIWKVLCGAAAAVMLAAIAGTRSYGGWAALVAGAIVAGFVFLRADGSAALRSTAKFPQNRGTSHFYMLPAGFVAVWFVQSLDQTPASRIAGRVYLSRIAWSMFKEHPLLGSGWGTFQLGFLDHQARFLAAHPEFARFWTVAWELHNDPLQLLVEAGGLGFAAFCWLLVAYGMQVRKTARAANSRRALIWLSAGAGGAAAILADSVINFQFAVAPTLILFFTFLAFPNILGENAETEEENQQPRGTASAPLLRVMGGLGVAALAAALLTQTAQRALAQRDYQRGINLESSGDWQGAEQADRAGIGEDASSGRLHFALSRVLYLQQKYSEALNEAQLAEPTYSDSHLIVLKARILDHMGRGDRALESYRRALFLDPTLKTVQADIERLEKPSPP